MDGQDERGNANQAADKTPPAKASTVGGGGPGKHWASSGAVAVLGLCVLVGFVINQCSPANQAKALALAQSGLVSGAAEQ